MTINIDGISHQIDTTNPDLLTSWILEIFGRIPGAPAPATYITVQIYPSVLWSGTEWKPDWIADSRVLSQVYHVKEPRDIIDALSQQLEEKENLYEPGHDRHHS
jgi:hypothetical protein